MWKWDFVGPVLENEHVLQFKVGAEPSVVPLQKLKRKTVTTMHAFTCYLYLCQKTPKHCIELRSSLCRQLGLFSCLDFFHAHANLSLHFWHKLPRRHCIFKIWSFVQGCPHFCTNLYLFDDLRWQINRQFSPSLGCRGGWDDVQMGRSHRKSIAHRAHWGSLGL